MARKFTANNFLRQLRTFLLLGGNIGDVEETLTKAKTFITDRIGSIKNSSALYETAAWGKVDQPAFLNQVIVLDCTLSPSDLLAATQEIEKLLGRVRHEHWGARTIDIDILFYGDVIMESQRLVIPHPQLHLRQFTLIPLSEVASDFIHPLMKKSIQTLLSECEDKLEVIKKAP